MSDEYGFISRREFLAGTLAGTAGLWIDASLPRPSAAAEAAEDQAPRVLTRWEWTQIEAITGRIIPTDDTPGALEAACVNFIDKALANEDAGALTLYRAALLELDRVCRQAENGDPGKGFAESTEQRQDQILSALETGTLSGWRDSVAGQQAFFETVRLHTILGFVLDPSYGGNRDYVGWKAMGFPGPVHHLGGSRPEQMRGEQAFVPIWRRDPRAHRDDRDV
jgi:gluconate 2-dehydrogenase gamma chain